VVPAHLGSLGVCVRLNHCIWTSEHAEFRGHLPLFLPCTEVVCYVEVSISVDTGQLSSLHHLSCVR